MQALGRMAAALGGDKANGFPALAQSSTVLDRIATKFAGYVSRTNRLRNVMLAWLRNDGKILLSELVRVSGVKKQHDYAGVGSALTRNMKKAGGPEGWYDGHETANEEWVYEIADELVQPLKRAFGLES